MAYRPDFGVYWCIMNIQFLKEVISIQTAKLWKKCVAPKTPGWKRYEIKDAGGHKFTWIIVIKIFALNYYNNYFLAATFDFTSAVFWVTHFFHSLAVFVYIKCPLVYLQA